MTAVNFTVLYYRDHNVPVLCSRQEIRGSYFLQCAPRVCVYVLVALAHMLMFLKKNLNAVDCRPSEHPHNQGRGRSERWRGNIFMLLLGQKLFMGFNWVPQ